MIVGEGVEGGALQGFICSAFPDGSITHVIVLLAIVIAVVQFVERVLLRLLDFSKVGCFS